MRSVNDVVDAVERLLADAHDAGARPAAMRWFSWLAGGALLLYLLMVYWG